jgi:hypothetical protein
MEKTALAVERCDTTVALACVGQIRHKISLEMYENVKTDESIKIKYGFMLILFSQSSPWEIKRDQVRLKLFISTETSGRGVW